MAFNFKYTRYSAITQIVLGVLSIIFGIADRVAMYRRWAFHSMSVVPIWMGAWFVITGIIGIFGSRRYPNSDRPSTPLVATYLAFSIVSIVFASVIIIMYSMGLAFVILRGEPCSQHTSYKYVYSQNIRVSKEYECNTSAALGAMVIIFAVTEFGAGIWASICCCIDGCLCCRPMGYSQPPTGQVIYIQTQQGPAAYVMTQGSNGVPVAVPALTTSPVAMTPGQAQQGAFAASYAGAGTEEPRKEPPPDYQTSL